MTELKLTISSAADDLKLSLDSAAEPLKLSLDESDSQINIRIENVGSGINLPKYDGGYDVTPTVDGTVLKTEQKVMEQDLTINAIPYFEVSNTSGGNTVYIGKEVE